MMMEKKVKLKSVNPCITCALCKGYLIDATTITECLHTCKYAVVMVDLSISRSQFCVKVLGILQFGMIVRAFADPIYDSTIVTMECNYSSIFGVHRNRPCY